MRRFLFAAAAFLSFLGNAYAQTGSVKPLSQLVTEINTNFADNVSNAITPAQARQTFLDMVTTSLQIWTPAAVLSTNNANQNAAAVVAAFASSPAVFIPPGAFSFGGLTVPSGSALWQLPGSVITYTGGAFVIAGQNGAAVWDMNYNREGWVLAKAFTGARGVIADPYGVLQYGFPAFGVVTSTDNSALGTGFGITGSFVSNFGGAAATGGRVALQGTINQTAITGAGSLNRNYVGIEGVSITNTGDGGTNTGAGSLGNYFGGNTQCRLGASATNVANCFSVEIDVYSLAGATARYIAGAAIVNFTSMHGVTIDAGIVFYGGGNSGLGGPGIGWNQGIFFTDVVGGTYPIASTGSVLTAAFPNNGNPATVAHGIDLSNFACSIDCFKSPGFTVTPAGGLAFSDTALLTKSFNGQTGYNVSNLNAGAGAVASNSITTNAGTLNNTAVSIAGGSFAAVQSTINGTFFVDAIGAAATFSFRTGSGPGAALNISAAGVLQAPLTATGTPAASLCMDASSNIIKKLTAGSCI